MITSPTIFKYLARKFSWYLFLITLIIISVLFISCAFDILQKFKSVYLKPHDLWLLILLKIPYLFNEISSIIGFISTILFLRYLISNNELIIIIGSGIPSWQVFMVPAIVSFLFGALTVSAINPIGTYGLREYQKIEAKLNNLPQNNLLISKSGIFFYEKYNNTNRIIHAKSIDLTKKMLLDLTILVVDGKNHLIERIDASSAVLENGKFEINNPVIFNLKENKNYPSLYLSTNLSVDNLIQKFMPPEMISIWYLLESIEEINSSGLPSLNYQLQFFKQMFKPLSISALALLACWSLNLNVRDNSSTKNIIFALIMGLSTYFLLEIILRILAYSGVSPLFATLLPILFIILISNFVILHFQEA